MAHGASSIHKQMRMELENYIRSQYFGKSPILQSAVQDVLDQEGVLYRRPYIESSPAYQTAPGGIHSAQIPGWMRTFFLALAKAGNGVYEHPFCHQVSALEAAVAGKDLLVATGTGSGKTECFLWPLMAKLAEEARNNPSQWEQRGVRTIVMYPMNALVSDQIGRLRRLIGDPENRFISIFRNTCGAETRRPQFGMYTGRTPYPGPEPKQENDRRLERTLARMSFPQTEKEKAFFEQLQKEGKIPAKANMEAYLNRLHIGRHIPDAEDAELITRFEMQQCCPDILITNYSMLEYMLLRPIEQKIWTDTSRWLHADAANRLLFIIDEAHMYRGSSGGEVALLIRRLLDKLGIRRDQVQFILTTASMPNSSEEDRTAVAKFAKELTAADDDAQFCYLTGVREQLADACPYDIPSQAFADVRPECFEGTDEEILRAMNAFWTGIADAPVPFPDLQTAQNWMYDNLVSYRPFHEVIRQCRGTAVSLSELANTVFPELGEEEGLRAVNGVLAIAPLARDIKGAVLFPARMHMLFRGIKGVFACTNPCCTHAHSDGTLTLGEIMLNDGQMTCPHCGSVVYELYNDRRCGTLFFKGYVREEEMLSDYGAYLWRYPGQIVDGIKEIHLFIPQDDYILPKKNRTHPIRPCYLDTGSGFINYRDDSWAGKAGVRKLYYCQFSAKGRPEIMTFPVCPHCWHQFQTAQLTSFSTRGNQPFSNLVQTQFYTQSPVRGKDNDPDRLPNEGRKVLLFSDSRQRAARLAKDLSGISDILAARQLFALAVREMEQSTVEYSLNELYDYFCLSAGKNHVQIFHNEERAKFHEDCLSALGNLNRSAKRKREYVPRFSIANAPMQMQTLLLRLYAGGYNTLQDSAVSWLEPTDQAMFDSVDALDEAGISVSDEEFLEVFNAWMISICNTATALGHTIPDSVRLDVRPCYSGYGLDKNWDFSQDIKGMLGFKQDSKSGGIWRQVLKENFLDAAQPDNDRLYVDLSRIKPRYDESHSWFRCEQCSEITPYRLRGRCPSCGSDRIHMMTENEYAALDFWRQPVKAALDGERIRVIDTEEHTAQISHKDQRDSLWSKTEQYELRFQDLIQEDETPVDVLSSTTTMEVGIDIGSLVAVGLRNIPPMRENYQQRAGRAGRRGASLSTIVTFCEDGPHDALYYNDPVPMFRGDPRRPWIDIDSVKLLYRHVTIVSLREYLDTICESIDHMPAAYFLDAYLGRFFAFIKRKPKAWYDSLLPQNNIFQIPVYLAELQKNLVQLKQKRDSHPDLFHWEEGQENKQAKPLLDALYEEGIIPTYSFPKNVVSTYVMESSGRVKFEVDRGLDVAISEYAPGRAIVVDKQIYQIGGLFSPGSERRTGDLRDPARAYIQDANYRKSIRCCSRCGWFGLEEEGAESCPSCGGAVQISGRTMLRPWGFAPTNGQATQEAQLSELYSSSQPPQYSTASDSSVMQRIPGWKHVRMAQRANQKLIMLNQGVGKRGFLVCADCGAAVPGSDPEELQKVDRPYKSVYLRSKCRHPDTINVDLGYDFVTDMLVLEFWLENEKVDTSQENNPWLPRAAQSVAEALRLAATKVLDVEATELVTGYRVRSSNAGTYLDIYLYDSLSSGAGYAETVGRRINEILEKVESLLTSCSCDGACYQCLKHYRNQNVHGLLNRFLAKQLLEWGKDGTLANPIPKQLQRKYLYPMRDVLKYAGVELVERSSEFYVRTKKGEKRVVVYPAMLREPREPNTVFLSDGNIMYAKPYAVGIIRKS